MVKKFEVENCVHYFFVQWSWIHWGTRTLLVCHFDQNNGSSSGQVRRCSSFVSSYLIWSKEQTPFGSACSSSYGKSKIVIFHQGWTEVLLSSYLGEVLYECSEWMNEWMQEWMNKLRLLHLYCLHLLTVVRRTYLVIACLIISLSLPDYCCFCFELPRCQYVLHWVLLIGPQRYADVAYLPSDSHRSSSHSEVVSHWQSSTTVRSVVVSCHSFKQKFCDNWLRKLQILRREKFHFCLISCVSVLSVFIL